MEQTKRTMTTPTGGGKKWIRRWKVFGIFFAISNGRLKKKPPERYYHGGWKAYVDLRKSIFEHQHHRCAICGAEFEDFRLMETHHALPWARFPELRDDESNIMMLCHSCHKEIHCNPYKNIAIMEAKANELGVELAQRYETRFA